MDLLDDYIIAQNDNKEVRRIIISYMKKMKNGNEILKYWCMSDVFSISQNNHTIKKKNCLLLRPSESWQSGRMRRSWKPLIFTDPGVRIPHSPLFSISENGKPRKFNNCWVFCFCARAKKDAKTQCLRYKIGEVDSTSKRNFLVYKIIWGIHSWPVILVNNFLIGNRSFIYSLLN